MGFQKRGRNLAGRLLAVWLLLTIWVATHPWEGIRHDAILYAAQALSRIEPAVFADDLFFAYGSQDRFTIFGTLYAAVIGLTSLGTASLGLLGLAQLGWLLVTIAWVRHHANPAHRLVIAAICMAVPGLYGAESVLRYAESFLTARSFAEPLVLAGLLAVWVRHTAVGFALLACATAMHPIMALPGLMTAVLIQPMVAASLGSPEGCRKIAIAGLITAAAIVVPSFFGLMPQMSTDWFDIVVQRSPFVIPSTWGFIDWVCQIQAPILLAAVALNGRGTADRLWAAIGFSAVVGLVVTIVAMLLRWDLGLQAQAWRCGWLAVWAAPLAALCRAADDGVDRNLRMLLVAVVPALVLAADEWSHLAAALALIHGVLVLVWCVFRPVDSQFNRMVVVSVVVLMLAVALWHGWYRIELALAELDHRLSPAFAGSIHRALIDAFGWLLLPALALVATRLSIASRFPKPILAAALLFFTTWALWLADDRAAEARRVDMLRSTGYPAWEQVIPKEASVFWPDHLSLVWFVLGRESYVSRTQLAGVVFSEATALEGARRMSNATVIGGRDAVLQFNDADRHARKDPPDAVDLRAACQDPRLDFVALPYRFEPQAAPPFVDPLGGREHYLYACADFRDRGTFEGERDPVASGL